MTNRFIRWLKARGPVRALSSYKHAPIAARTLERYAAIRGLEAELDDHTVIGKIAPMKRRSLYFLAIRRNGVWRVVLEGPLAGLSEDAAGRERPIEACAVHLGDAIGEIERRLAAREGGER